MCGLTYYHQKGIKSAVKPVLTRYEIQKSRGTEGYGLVAFDLDTREVTGYIREEEEKDIAKQMHALRKSDKVSNGILFHHRNPTSTPNLRECAHPIGVRHEELEDLYFIAHNGVISNDHELKKKHEQMGYRYNTEITKEESWTTSGLTGEAIRYTYPKELKHNDSEAVAIELARVIEGKSDKIGAKGSMALIALRVSPDMKVKALYYGRNYLNPLCLVRDRNSFALTSEGETKDSIKAHTLYCYDYATGETTETPCNFGDNYSNYGKGSLWSPKRDEWRDMDYLPLPKPKDEDLEDYGIHTAPSITSEQYFEDRSTIDYTIEELEKDGLTHEEMSTMTLEEFYTVEELLEWENVVGDKKMQAQLEERKKALDERLDLLDVMMIEETTMGYNIG